MGRKEANIERYVQRRVQELGGFTRKVTYQGRSGAADQWCFMPDGRLLQIECKASGEKPSAMQLQEKHVMSMQGFTYIVVDSREAFDEFVRANFDIASVGRPVWYL